MTKLMELLHLRIVLKLFEIMDESDTTEDMRELAKRKMKQKRKEKERD